MKTRFLLPALALGAAWAFSGCGSIGEPLAERFHRPPVVQSFTAPADKVFAAARDALQAMGYTIRTAHPQTGEIEAFGAVGIDDRFRSADQRNCRVRVVPLPDGSVDVRLEVREQMEERTASGMARQSERVLPQGAIHDHFFAELQRRL